MNMYPNNIITGSVLISICRPVVLRYNYLIMSLFKFQLSSGKPDFPVGERSSLQLLLLLCLFTIQIRQLQLLSVQQLSPFLLVLLRCQVLLLKANYQNDISHNYTNNIRAVGLYNETCLSKLNLLPGEQQVQPHAVCSCHLSVYRTYQTPG